MARVTSKLQLTVPKVIADQYKIRPGDDLDWLAAGDAIRVVKRGRGDAGRPVDTEQRLRLFDQATARQIKREGGVQKKVASEALTSEGQNQTRRGPRTRDWTRGELYQHGFSR
jgi:bifunctional DNA-binding transcriptional regulator/antitoxin component of YhaV-PrlF toxin-antitoxin module